MDLRLRGRGLRLKRRKDLNCFEVLPVGGNVLDLWAAERRLPLYVATLELAKTFGLQIDLNREEEPVRPIPRTPR